MLKNLSVVVLKAIIHIWWEKLQELSKYDMLFIWYNIQNDECLSVLIIWYYMWLFNFPQFVLFGCHALYIIVLYGHSGGEFCNDFLFHLLFINHSWYSQLRIDHMPKTIWLPVVNLNLSTKNVIFFSERLFILT